MKVILRESVPKLGQAGDIKEVRMGFGFNFLIPRGLALLATSSNVKRVLSRVQALTKKHARDAEKLAVAVKSLDGFTLSIVMKAQNGKLFGSVGPTLIVEALKKKGYLIHEEALELPQPIKELGLHQVTAKAGDETAVFTVSVESESE